MNKINIENTIKSLIDTFLFAGKIAIELRKKGLIQKELTKRGIEWENLKKK